MRLIILLNMIMIINGLYQQVPLALQNSFADKQQVGHIEYSDDELIKILSNEKVIITITGKIKRIVCCYDMRGQFSWKRNQECIKDVYISTHSDKILIKHGWKMGDFITFTCLNSNGDELWSRELVDQPFEINDDGKYGITKGISNDEMDGNFLILDMETGEPIPNSINSHKYSFFHAAFSSNSTVCLLLSKRFRVRTREQEENYKEQFREMYYQHMNNGSQFELLMKSDEFFEKQLEQFHKKKYIRFPLQFVNYNIETKTVTFQRWLISDDGKAFLDVNDVCDDCFNLNKSKYLVAFKTTKMEVDSLMNLELFVNVVNLYGNDVVLTDFKRVVHGYEFINDHLLLTRYYKNHQMHIGCFDINTQKERWSINKKRLMAVKDIFINENNLFFSCYPKYDKDWCEHYQLDINTGEILANGLPSHEFYKVFGDYLLIIDSKSKQIRIYN